MWLRGNKPLRSRVKVAVSVPVAASVSVMLLVAAGVAYRIAASAWGKTSDKNIELPVLLSEIPRQIGGWSGEDLKIEAATEEYMRTNFADDYMSRRYVNKAERLFADAYVVYCSTRPSGILGHRPQICYPGSGYEWDGTTQSDFTTQSGRKIECLIHCFHTRPPAFQQVYVLNFYVLNGRITLSEKGFSSLFDRRPNLDGDLARYVAQVQISSFNTEYPARALASQIADIILRFLPDQDGLVAVVDTLADSNQAAETPKGER
jgi:hypothetical protein